MTSRYEGREKVINDHESYRSLIKKKGLKFLNQYSTPELRYPTEDEISDLDLVGHTWQIGDRFYKLAFEYYGDSTLWWILAWFNRTPTEQHIKIGETIYIPLPLEEVLQLLGV